MYQTSGQLPRPKGRGLSVFSTSDRYVAVGNILPFGVIVPDFRAN